MQVQDFGTQKILIARKHKKIIIIVHVCERQREITLEVELSNESFP